MTSLTTAERLAYCRDADREAPYQIVICGNAETLCDGWCETDEDLAHRLTDAAIETLWAHARANEADWQIDRIFHRWHGGRHYKAGCRIGEHRYGYRCGEVCTHEIDPPQWLCDLIDEMSGAMSDLAMHLSVSDLEAA